MILRDFRKQIENVINASGLSIDCIYYVFSDIMNELKVIFDEEIEKENYERAQEQLKKEKDAATEVSGELNETQSAGTDTAAGQE